MIYIEEEFLDNVGQFDNKGLCRCLIQHVVTYFSSNGQIHCCPLDQSSLSLESHLAAIAILDTTSQYE